MPENHRRLLLVALTTTMALLVLDSSIVGVMLPTVSADLRLSPVQQGWTVASYLLALTVLLPVGGRTTDAVGARRAFLGSMSGFVLASALIAVAGGPAELLAGRVLAGAAAALLMPATAALLSASYEGAARARAMATYLGVGQAFALVGPAVGGWCAQYPGWRWGFALNVPVGVLGVALVLALRPTGAGSSARPRGELGAAASRPRVLFLAAGVLFVVGAANTAATVYAAGTLQ